MITFHCCQSLNYGNGGKERKKKRRANTNAHTHELKWKTRVGKSETQNATELE